MRFNLIYPYAVELPGFETTPWAYDAYYDRMMEAVEWCDTRLGAQHKRWTINMRAGQQPCLFEFKRSKDATRFKLMFG